MSHISSTTQTPIYDQVSNLEKSHGDKELKLTSNGTVATKMFGSNSTMGKITARLGTFFGYDDGAQVKEQFLEEFKKKLTIQINDSDLKPAQKQELSNSVNSLDLESFLQKSSDGKPAPKLTAKTLMTFATEKTKNIQQEIQTKVDFNRTSKPVSFLFSRLTVPKLPKNNPVRLNNRIDMLTLALQDGTKEKIMEDPRWDSSLTKSDKFLIRNHLGLQQSRSGNVRNLFKNTKDFFKTSSTPTSTAVDIQTKITTLNGKLGDSKTSPTKITTQSDAPQIDDGNKTRDQLAQLIHRSLEIGNSKRNPEQVLQCILNLEKNPKLADKENKQLAFQFLRDLRQIEREQKVELNSTITGIINVINSAKTEHDSTENKKLVSSKVAFSKEDAQNALEKYINDNQPED
jgi:hypothetical protein